MSRVKYTLLAAGLVLALAFTFSCSGDDVVGDGVSSSSGGGGGGNSNWPNNTVLTEWGLGGMPAPTGATNITHSIATVGGNSITIRFTCSSENDSPINTWFTSNGWTSGTILTQGDILYWQYTKEGFDEANYTRNTTTNTNSCQIQVVKD